MSSIETRNPKPGLRDGVSRRRILQAGGTGLLAGLALPQLLHANATGDTRKAKAKACIFIFLEGGPPQLDMWDPKPDQPEEIRGPFAAISTSVPGTFFTEYCAESAKIAHKFTVVRSHTHADNGHTTGYHYVMTGRRPPFADGEHPIPVNAYFPSLGSLVAKELGPAGSVPPYINLPDPMPAGGPGFLGVEYAPLVIEADSSQHCFATKGIPAENDRTRDAYGRTQIGQCALFARQLVERGCRFVGINMPGWDVHFNCFPSLKEDLIPPADCAFAALVNDLEQRGMLEETLVVMMGEMGRSPRVNAQAGRDHWSMVQSILFAGGGTQPGQIIGETDKQAAVPTRDPVSMSDLLVTIYTLLGIDPRKENIDPLGRSLALVDGGKVIPGLIA